MKADTRLMKQLNKSTLRNILSQKRTATKPELAKYSGLSVVTVNALLSEMLYSGEVQEGGNAPSGGGRPSMQYRYNYDYRTVAVVYGHQLEGRSYIHTLAVNLDGKKLWERQEYMEEIGPESFDSALDEVFAAFGNTGLIAFGLPGEAIGNEVIINDFKGLEGRVFLPRIRERYQVPVLFENDINAMTCGYYQSKCAEGEACVAGIYFPRSFFPGAGLVLNGSIYYGASHFAGEMGAMYTPVPWDKLDYFDEEQVLHQLEEVLVSYSCIAAPSRFVLYGDFFTADMSRLLEQRVGSRLGGSFRVRVETSEKLEEDYETGMISLALKRIVEDMDALQDREVKL